MNGTAAPSGDEARTRNLPVYRFRPGFVVRWLASQAGGRPRCLGQDAAAEVGHLPGGYRVEGAERIPRGGSFVLVMNHFERPGLRVWWPALLVSAVLWHVRGQEPPVRWMITDRFYGYRVGPVRLPRALVAWLLRRIARTYGLILVPRPAVEGRARARALLEARAALRGPDARPVGLTPEAETGGGRRLGRAWRNAGAAVAVLSAGTTPVLPVVVFEDAAGRLVARFGRAEPFDAMVDGRAAAAEALMARLEALMPPGATAQEAQS